VKLDKTFWWGGFKVTLTEAELITRPSGTSLHLTLSEENLGTQPARLDQHDISLTADGRSVQPTLTDLPDVPGKAKNEGAVSFYAEGEFSLDAATLTFGSPDRTQAVVPLGSDQPTSYQPKKLTASAALSTGQAKATFQPGVLDASYQPNERGKFIVRIPMAFTYTGTARGGYYLGPDQFTLTTPDGNSAVGAPIAPFDLVAEAVDPGKTLDTFLAFKLATPANGPMTLAFKDSAGGTSRVTLAVS
jgi:hypothetical protein